MVRTYTKTRVLIFLDVPFYPFYQKKKVLLAIQLRKRHPPSFFKSTPLKKKSPALDTVLDFKEIAFLFYLRHLHLN